MSDAPRSTRRHPEPIEGESLLAWATRAAMGRSLPRLWSLLRECGLAYLDKPGALLRGGVATGEIARVLRADEGEIERRVLLRRSDAPGFERLDGMIVRSTDVVTQTRRFAPARLGETGTHMQTWMLQTLPFCPVTWQYLTDRCGRCRRIQRWKPTIDVRRCDGCGFLLERGAAEAVDSSLRGSLARVASLTVPFDENHGRLLAELTPAGCALEAGAAFDAVVELARVIDPTLPRTEPAVVDMAHAKRLSIALAASIEALLRWPESAKRVLPTQSRAAYKRLQAALGHDGRPSLTEVATILALPFDRRFVATKPAARALGITETAIAHARGIGALVTAGLLDAGIRWGCDADEIERLSAIRRGRIGRHRAAMMLGVPLYGLEQLIGEGLLPTHDAPWVRHRFGEAVLLKDDIIALMVMLEAAGSEMPADGVRISTAMRSYGGGPKPWAAIFRMLLAGNLGHSTMRGPAGLLQIVLPARSAGILRGLPPGKGLRTYVQSDALEIINAGARAVSMLEHMRLEASQAGRSWSVDGRRLEDYAREHVTTAEIMARSGLAQKTAQAILHGRGCVPSGSYAWQRASVATLAADLLA